MQFDSCAQSCRGCLMQDNGTVMYDLAVPETLKLFNECANTNISIHNSPPSIPQHLCTMCYRLCELMQGFRERCQKTEKQIRVTKKQSKVKREPLLDETKVAEEKHQDIYYSMVEVSMDDELVKPEADATEWMKGASCSGDTNEMEERPSDTFGPRIKKKKKAKSEATDPSSFPANENLTSQLESPWEFGPGPNTTGVWMHFLRDKSRLFGKCLECDRIIRTPNGGTSSLRKHLLKIHNISCPTRDVLGWYSKPPH